MGRSLRSAPASRSRLSTKLNDDQTQLYWRLAIIEVLALLRTSRAGRAAFNVLQRVFPNLIAVATRRKQVSSFLKRSSILSIAQHFGPHFIILPDAVVLADPSNFGKHSAERRAHNLLLTSHTFHQRRDFLCPGNSGSGVTRARYSENISRWWRTQSLSNPSHNQIPW
jgi:hypothetical protein